MQFGETKPTAENSRFESEDGSKKNRPKAGDFDLSKNVRYTLHYLSHQRHFAVLRASSLSCPS